MDEYLWTAKDSTGDEVELYRTGQGEYVLRVDGFYAPTSSAVTLDRKHLKDLFDAIGRELNAL